MNFIDEIYIGESIKDLRTIVYALNRKIPVYNIYCLCMEPSSKFLMEIINSKELFKDRYSDHNYTIIGLAGGKREAFDLVRFIVQESINGVWDFENLKNSIIGKS